MTSFTPPHPVGPTPPAPPAGGARRISRDDIVALAKQGRLWEFVPLALCLLRQFPQDDGVRLLVATAYARLGLRDASVEQLAKVGAAAQAERSVLELRRALEQFPQTEMAAADRVAVCRANVEALKSRGVDLMGLMAEWEARHRAERWYSTRDGNVVRRSVSATPDDPWIHFRNDRLEADNFPFPHLATPDKTVKPYAIEGVSPPWMLQRLHERTPAGADGYRVRLSVMQEGSIELLDGFACAEMAKLIADDRVEWHVGAGAAGRYRAALDGRMGTQAGGPAISLATVRQRAVPALTQVLESFSIAQHAEHRRLLTEVERAYAGRDRAWWHARYTKPGERLRVLVPTCRYSTFVKHSAADLAEAFGAAGWEARVLIEPDDRSHLASVGYLRELAEFVPDLVVLINYTRTSVGNFFPPTLPFVCWLQDAMPHQFDAALAAKQGDFDYLAGYLHPELFTQFGFSRERTAAFAVAVSPRKFHAGPVTTQLEARLTCEVAYVSHHSETPEAMHARLVREAGSKEPLAARIFEELLPRVREIALNPDERIAGIELPAVAAETARRVLGGTPPEGTVTLVNRQYCLPMADRLIRHQTLEWAASLARERGWRLHLHGKGWERHPTLSGFARGELAHDEELRASYACAGVHLHASSNWLLHQRVMECAMSGGLPLSRLKKSDVMQCEQAVLRSMVKESPIVMERRTALLYREYGYATADSAAGMEFAAQLQRLGIPASWDMWIHGRRYDECVATPAGAAQPPAGWVLGDISETTFRTREQLGVLIERAIADRGWRERTAGVVASRTRARYSTDVLVGTLKDMVRASVAPGA